VIHPLRRRHRLLITALAVVVPTLYLLALAARPSFPEDGWGRGGIPPSLEPIKEVGRELAAWPDLWPEPVRLTTRLVAMPDGLRALELLPVAPPDAPDLLLYWTPAAHQGDPASAGETLPGEAWLLGPFAPESPIPLPLPEVAWEGGGTLLLYSLGHQRLVAHAALPALPSPPLSSLSSPTGAP